MKQRSICLDACKGVAIISVVLFHLGLFREGYLGVDFFYVIAGYLTTRSLDRQIKGGTFRFWRYIGDRIVRLLPLVLIISFVSLVIGAMLMLPDDFENLAESVVASCFFGNNFLQWWTTKNYWAATNEVKPLMHLWYLGVLMQFYLLSTLAGNLVLRVRTKRGHIMLLCGIALLGGASAFLSFAHVGDSGMRFYLLPWRIWEFVLGAACYYCSSVSAIFTRVEAVVRQAPMPIRIGINLLSAVGIASMSVYVWHQPILSFVRYSLFTELDVYFYAAYALVMIVLSWFSYRVLEPLPRRNSRRALVVLWGSLALVSGTAYGVYEMAGVWRDVPELDVYTGYQKRGMHAQYNERVRRLNKAFVSDRIKVLCVGDSFSRDWANVLLESEISSRIEVSYFPQNYLPADAGSRIAKADYIFYTTLGDFSSLPDCLSGRKVYVIGPKYFGNSNGQTYSRRFRADYFETNVQLPAEVLARNARQSREYGDNFVDIISPVLREKSCVPVFTDDRKYISQDCRHFTRAGACFFARVLAKNGVLKKFETK